MTTTTRSRGSAPAPSGRPARQGGYPRGDETRTRIVRCAVAVFGQFGYAAASMREIAARADVKAAALHYYFQGKAGLFHACMDHVTDAIWRHSEPMVLRATEALAGRPAKAELIALYCDLQDVTIDAFYDPDQGISIGRLLASGADREELRDATALMDQRVVLPVFAANAMIVGRILGREPGDPVTGLHTVAVNGMTMVFHFARKDVATMIGWADPSRDEITRLKAVVRAQATLVLAGLADGDAS